MRSSHAIATPGATPGAPLTGRRVAIIEDDRTTAMIAERVCRSLGASDTVVCADRASAALTLTDPRAPVDVVLLDMALDADDGIAALRHLGPELVRAEIVPVSRRDPRLLDAAARLLAGRGFRVHAPIVKPLPAAKLDEVLSGATVLPPAFGSGPPQPRREELAGALSRDEFVPFYQVQCDIGTLRPRGAEVLARWNRANGSLIAPGRFVPGLEAAGLIGAMTERLLARALDDLVSLGPAQDGFGLALNISAPSLADPTLPDRLHGIVTAHAMDTGRVTFEITESAVLHDPLALLEGAARLRLHGFRLAIDDFGTGWSSLELLRALPFTELKIDRSFVSGAPEDCARQVILRNTVAMARELGLDIVAEGVETEAERAFLASLGVPVIQGWLSGRPVPFADLAASLARGLSQPHPEPPA